MKNKRKIIYGLILFMMFMFSMSVNASTTSGYVVNYTKLYQKVPFTYGSRISYIKYYMINKNQTLEISDESYGNYYKVRVIYKNEYMTGYVIKKDVIKFKIKKYSAEMTKATNMSYSNGKTVKIPKGAKITIVSSKGAKLYIQYKKGKTLYKGYVPTLNVKVL